MSRSVLWHWVGYLTTAITAVFLAIPLQVTTAYADSNSITVTAVVPPNTYIILNKKGVVERIISNSSQYVIPRVFINSVQGQEIPLNHSTYQTYLQLTNNQKLIKDGVIYDISTSPDLESSKKPLIVSFIDLSLIESISRNL